PARARQHDPDRDLGADRAAADLRRPVHTLRHVVRHGVEQGPAVRRVAVAAAAAVALAGFGFGGGGGGKGVYRDPNYGFVVSYPSTFRAAAFDYPNPNQSIAGAAFGNVPHPERLVHGDPSGLPDRAVVLVVRHSA